MKKIIVSIVLLVGFASADISDNINQECQKIIDSDGKYKVAKDSYMNGVLTGIFTAVDKRYHRSQIIGKKDKIMLYACKEAFARKDSNFAYAFVKGVQVNIDRRWSRFRKVK